MAGLAALAMASCDESFNDWEQQASNTQPATVTFGDGSVAEVGLIDFATFPEEITDADSTQVCVITAPTSSYASTSNEYYITLNGEQTFSINASGKMLTSELKTYVEGKYGKNPVERDMSATLTAYTGDGNTAVQTGFSSSPFTVRVKPDAPFIDPDGYYVVGNIDGWSCTRKDAYHMTNGGADVYSVPTFTVYLNPVESIESSDGIYQIKIIPSSAFAEDGSMNGGNWSIALSALPGVTDPAYSGSFNYSNEGDNIKFNKIDGAKKYKISVNLLEGTYTVEAFNQAEIYLTGGNYGSGNTWIPFVAVNQASESVVNKFWKIIYLHDNEQFKFATQQAWGEADKGENFTGELDGELKDNFEISGGNIVCHSEGWYLVMVNNDTRHVYFSEPALYLTGDCSKGSWNNFTDADKFTNPTTEDGEFVSPAFTASDKAIRMCVLMPTEYGIDWWRSEFIVKGGIIVFRANGGDPAKVMTVAGQRVHLNFTNNTGSYE